MLDCTIKHRKAKGPLKIPYSDPYTDDEFSHLKKHHFRIGSYDIYGLSYTDEDNDIYEDDEHLLIIIGDVYYRLSEINFKRKVVANELLQLVNNQDAVLKTLKGNFTLIHLHKPSGKLIAQNDHFALRPFYYGAIGEDYVLSSNQWLVARNESVNPNVLLESVLYTYPIGDESLLGQFKYLPPGTRLSIDSLGVQLQQSSILLELFTLNVQNRFQFNDYLEKFNSCVLQRCVNNNDNVVSLTGGFDGRAVVSSLLQQNIPFTAYSFGMQGGENTRIPERVSASMNLNYTPIYLDATFEENYLEYAWKTINFSDGVSIFERLTNPYAFSRLSSKTDNVLTGLLAGEVLGPIHLKEDYFNELYYNHVLESHNTNLNDDLIALGLERFIQAGWSDSAYAAITEKVKQKQQIHSEIAKAGNSSLVYLYDLFETGFRRFYGTQMHTERFYSRNLPVFFDVDLIQMQLETSYRSTYNNSFKSLWHRRKGRKTQAQIIKSNSKQLSSIPVDRGFTPASILNPFGFISIPFQYYNRKRRVAIGPPDFDSRSWSRLFYSSWDKRVSSNDEYFKLSALKEYMSQYNINREVYNYQTNRLISLVSYINQI